ncbi:PAS domain S-box protein [Pelovirga terrestris]|uniref:histidine kinase n=1 Tax=Pelovirga terrestris TaxID=2771352 RepID=A0A8J6R4V9_9BACT|nr:PAS domain S-box protein [Pelovirga terrestris]MBD1399654.1 PAS domain S-box protein [Pelovirga terrestris]
MKQRLTRHALIAVILLALLPAALWGKDIPTIRVAAFNYYPAIFLDTDNRVRGFYVDMLDEISTREQLRFEYVFGSWSEGLERLQQGEVDLVTSAAFTEERATFMDFGEQVLLTVWGELYTPKDEQTVSITGFQNQPVAVMRGDHNARSFKEHLEKFGISSRFIEYADFDEVFAAVKAKKVRGGVVNSVFGDAAAKQYEVQSSGIAFKPFDIYFATAKGQNAGILRLLDDYLLHWRNDSASVYYHARLKWGAGQEPEEVIPVWVLKLAAVAALVIFSGLVFIVLLRHQVNKATRELQKSNNMIRLLLDSTAEGIYGLDIQGSCTFCNAACVQILGYDNEDQLIGRNMHDLIHHSHADGTAMPAEECDLLKGLERKVHCDSEMFWRADDSSFPVEYWSHPIRQEDQVIGLVVSFLNITERKRIEQGLIEQKNAYQSILSASHDGFLALDTQGHILDVNPAYLTFSGYDREELLSRHISEMDVNENAEDAALHVTKVMTQGSNLFESVHQRKDGSVWPAEVSTTYSPVNGGRFFTFLRDITERKKAQWALELKNQELEQFVYSVSHDLKSPLVTVRTYADMLRQDLQSKDQQQITEDLKYIDKAANKMQQLLDALLHYSRIGRAETHAQTLSAHQLVDDCLSALAGILEKQQIKVSTSELPQQLHGDSLHFERVWQNLIENAVKYRGNQDQLHIEIGTKQQGQDVIFYVRDNGMGIAPEHSERIFNLFSQLNPGSDGSGLGLALVKKIVSIYQGRIWVESAGEGQGSCFMFTLPGATVKTASAT